MPNRPEGTDVFSELSRLRTEHSAMKTALMIIEAEDVRHYSAQVIDRFQAIARQTLAQLKGAP